MGATYGIIGWATIPIALHERTLQPCLRNFGEGYMSIVLDSVTAKSLVRACQVIPPGANVPAVN